MQINLLTFLDPSVYRGGGEMISSQLMEVGAARGHDIRIASVRPRQIDGLHSSPDIVLLIDVFNFGHTLRSLGAWREFGETFLNQVIERAPFVHLTNAYVDICNLPYLPCSGNGEQNGLCSPKLNLGFTDKTVIRDWGVNCFAQQSIVRRLYEESALNVYLSPLHQKITESVLNIEESGESYILKPLIDIKRFTNEQKERDIEYLFVGVIGEAKGLEEMRNRFSDKDIHFVGRCASDEKLDFGTHHGHVAYDEIPNYMNRAKNFVFFPRWPEPQGRVVAEAALCGCNIIGNDNVGALSFDMDLSDPSIYKDVENNFWETVESLVK